MANQVIQTLETDIKVIEDDDQLLITRIRDRLAGRADADDLLDDELAEVKSHFGAKAANDVSDVEAEGAIAEVEQWIADNVSNGSIERRIAGVMLIRCPNDLLKELGA